MKVSEKASLRFYRAVIRDAWLPLVGRRKLTPTEYAYIQELFESSIEIGAVLKAIKKCRDRARNSGYTFYSLGIIKPDLEAVMREKSKTQVGASKPDENAWRERWREDITELITLVDEPFRSAYQGLLAELDSLSREQAQARWQAIQKLEKEP